MMITPGAGQCTAWGVDEKRVVTAGHCCDEPGKYTLITPEHRHIGATVLAFHLDYEDANALPLDVCLLETDDSVNWLPLALDMPAPNTPMEFVGYPLGKWVHGRGFYLGDVDGVQHWNDYATTAPCDHGASGSALFTEDGVFGVLVRLYVSGDVVYPGEMGCIATPLSQIQDVLKEQP